MRSASVCTAHGTANTISPSLLAPESTISFRVGPAVARGTPSTTSRKAESQKFMPPLFGPGREADAHAQSLSPCSSAGFLASATIE
jgi:hypothetical protein